MIDIQALFTYLNETEKELLLRPEFPELSIKSLPKLNDILWGLQKNEVTIIGARTSMGKTAFGLQLITDMLEQDISVLYMSFEMKPRSIIERMFSYQQRVVNLEIKRGKFKYYKKEWEEFKEKMKKFKIVMGDGFGKNWRDLNNLMKEYPKKPQVVVVDYIQSIAQDVQGKISSKMFMDEYIREFRQICVENDIAGVIISQLNRTNPDSKDKRPKLHQLKGTGFLEEHADTVILLDWLCKSAGNKDFHAFTIEVAKNRNGLTGFVDANYMPQCYRFEEIEKKVESQNNVIDKINQGEWDD